MDSLTDDLDGIEAAAKKSAAGRWNMAIDPDVVLALVAEVRAHRAAGEALAHQIAECLAEQAILLSTRDVARIHALLAAREPAPAVEVRGVVSRVYIGGSFMVVADRGQPMPEKGQRVRLVPDVGGTEG